MAGATHMHAEVDYTCNQPVDTKFSQELRHGMPYQLAHEKQMY